MNDISSLPQNTYTIGEIYEFKVKRLYSNYSELIDESTGVTTYLQGTAKLKLFIGQTVKCRVKAFTEKHPKIELVDITEFEQSKEDLSEEKLSELLAKQEVTWNTKDFIKLLLTDEKDKPFESQCHRWIQILLNKKIDLKNVRRDCSDLLELSDLLNICNNTERDFYQERLTLLIEQLGYYIKAEELIENETKEENVENPNQFIDNIFKKLRTSGFVYHPGKNFNILSCLFLRRPDLMNGRINELLEIIRQRDIVIWKKEPFKSALVKVLELYVRESESKIDKTKNNNELIKNSITALAIQLLILGEKSESAVADYTLNTARLCLLSSYLVKPNHLVDMAYYYLFHSQPKRIGYVMGNIDLIPHYINNMYPCGEIDTTNTYTKNNVKLSISSNGIQLLPSRPNVNTYSIFPKELGLWKGIQIFLNSKPETNLSSVKDNELRPYQDIWYEIEGEYFNNASRIPTATPTKKQKRHRLDDIVKISFISQDEDDESIFYCQIEDEIGGDGFINIRDIFPYKVQPSLRHFYATDGSRYVFTAKIIDQEDDFFHFSMSETIKDNLEDFYSDDEDIYCIVCSVPNHYGMAPGISKEGISVSLRNASDFEDIGKNCVVKCRLNGKGSGQFHIVCDIIDFASIDYDFSSAFITLLEEISVGRIPESISEQEEDQILETDKVLDESYVRELIYLIDRLAIIDKNYVKSYNYLAFARILCMLIGWESQAAYYKGRMDIITMLHFFAQNATVEEEKLNKLENANAELFSSNVILKERFKQLQIVSYLGKAYHNDDLYKISSSYPELKELSLLVLAYNIAHASKLDSSANNIHNTIKQRLNLKGFETGLKQYGSGIEDVDLEYKSSIVFSADKDSKGPKPEIQMKEILKVIDSFFNTVGGTLYIGVNNFGLGVGIEEDLKTPLYYGDKEKYIRSITDAITTAWGNSVTANYLESIGYDTDNKDKDVVIVKIKPIPQGVSYEGDWYIRTAGSKRKLTEQEFESYQKVNRNRITPSQANESTTTSRSEITSAPYDNIPLITSKEEKIKTSRIRKNVLDYYVDPDNYIEPIAFFKFLENNKFKKLTEYDYDDQSLLTLAVLEQERKGYLVLGYDNGHIVKVPIEELLDYNDREYSRNPEAKLIFASIANEDDLILTLLKDSKTKKTVMRADSLINFETERLSDSGKTPCNESLFSNIVSFDVIPSSYRVSFTGILDKKETISGFQSNPVTSSIVEALHYWGITEI